MLRRNPRILIVDDVPDFHREVRYAFRRGYEFEGAIGVDKLMEQLRSDITFDLILLDLVLEDGGEQIGLDLIPVILESRPGVPIIVVTNANDYKTAAEAIKRGAQNFLYKKEYDYHTWHAAFEEAIERANLKVQVKELKKEVQELKEQYGYQQHPKYPILGSSPQTERLRKSLKIAGEQADLTVLITGETGVGKSIAAHFLHHNSLKRRDHPFEEIFISNISQTLLEGELFGAKKGSYTGAGEDRVGRLQLADQGIVFLDEIGDLDLKSQSKLLQFLQKKTIRPLGGKKDIDLNVQVVAATNKVMLEEVAVGNFRRDLYERLKVFPIEIPPLRDRREDIQDLLLYFLALSDPKELQDIFTGEVSQILLHEYRWTGNVRELENAVTAMKLKQKLEGVDRINFKCLPDEIKAYSQANNKIISHANNGVKSAQGKAADDQVIPPLPDVTSLSRKDRKVFENLQEIERALILKNGVKGDAAIYLDYKSSDDIRYRVLKLRNDHPEWIVYFPRIKNSYERLLSGTEAGNDNP